jgi:hypothetical protein
MEEQVKTCVSVFRNGTIDKEGYTAVWIGLLNRLMRYHHVLARKEL